VRIAVDAMGGDHAPAEIVRGAAAAAVEYGIDISLVGLPAAVQPLLDSHPRLQLVPCTQAIAMDEHPAQAVRSKPDSSMAVCARLCKEGRADGWTSAGNSGAIMAAALLIQGRIRGVERPALGSIVPTQNGFAYFLDVGANVDSKPEYMVQFAAMGAVYAREMLGRAEPLVALLSNGEEEGKGDELVRETSRRLKGVLPASSVTSSPRTSMRRVPMSSSLTDLLATWRSRWPRRPPSSCSAACATRFPRRCPEKSAARSSGRAFRSCAPGSTGESLEARRFWALTAWPWSRTAGPTRAR